MTREELARRVEALGPWFHNLDLDGVQTAPDHFLGDYPRKAWRLFRHALPEDLSGWSVLDLGCNAGFYSIEMKRRGARRVLGLDSDARYLAQARLAAEVLEADVEFREGSVYDVGRLGERFDLVIFMGVLYHLRHPLLALDLLHEHVVDRMLVFQSMLRGSEVIAAVPEDHPYEDQAVFDHPGYPAMRFVEHAYAGDRTNWWIPNRAGVEAMLRSSGFEITARPEWTEVYVCRRVPRPAWVDPPPCGG